MPHIDQFESVFRSAAKAVYRHEPIALGRILVVTDMEAADAENLAQQTRGFLEQVIDSAAQWTVLPGSRFATVHDLLGRIAEHKPDLIVSYRHLHSNAWRWPHSLGEHLDVLTQVGAAPVLVLPHPDANRALPHTLTDTNRVMAVTDHLAGDDRLVHYATAFTQPHGICYLTHIEDSIAFDRYMDAISKIPELDTETARRLIADQLLKEPRDYIHSARAEIESRRLAISIEPIVEMGRHLSEYQRLIDAHKIDLLVFNTKEHDQMAMHGMAYSLAVELRQIPLLML